MKAERRKYIGQSKIRLGLPFLEEYQFFRCEPKTKTIAKIKTNIPIL